MVEVEETLAADVTAGSVVVLKLTEKRATGRVALFFTLSAPRRPQPSCAAAMVHRTRTTGGHGDSALITTSSIYLRKPEHQALHAEFP
jgi:hypothetical protein